MPNLSKRKQECDNLSKTNSSDAMFPLQKEQQLAPACYGNNSLQQGPSCEIPGAYNSPHLQIPFTNWSLGQNKDHVWYVDILALSAKYIQKVPLVLHDLHILFMFH